MKESESVPVFEGEEIIFIVSVAAGVGASAAAHSSTWRSAS